MRLDTLFGYVVHSASFLSLPEQTASSWRGTMDTMSSNRDTVGGSASVALASGAQLRRVSLELMASDILLSSLPLQKHNRFPAH
jgi:hypothetical protein